ncbi:hypothetical protein [Kitasatospora sp. NPDC056181]
MDDGEDVGTHIGADLGRNRHVGVARDDAAIFHPFGWADIPGTA